MAAAELHQQRVDLVLRHRVLPGPLAGVVALGVGVGHRHDPWIGQPVVDERVAALQQLAPAKREQPGVAGAGADQVDSHSGRPPAQAQLSTLVPGERRNGHRAAAAQLARPALARPPARRARRRGRAPTPGAPRRPAPARPARPGRPRAPAPPDRSGSRSGHPAQAGPGPRRPARSRRPRPRRAAAGGCRRCRAAARSAGRAEARRVGPTAAPTTFRCARRPAPPPATPGPAAGVTRVGPLRAPPPITRPVGHVAGQVLGAVHDGVDLAVRPAPARARA